MTLLLPFESSWAILFQGPDRKHPWLPQLNPIGVSRPVHYQQDLFPLADAPDGLFFEPEIMTATEESGFLKVIKELPFGAVRMHGVDARRHVVRYGSHYVARAAALAGISTQALSESLMTEYPSGAGIGWHRDSPPFGIAAGISLSSGCRMRFQRAERAKRQTWTIELPPRSLYVMSGSAREEWQHGILPVKEPRWSITFRMLRSSPVEHSTP
jgi:alkylated DNA repair protein (DNA oxidative demethylase)